MAIPPCVRRAAGIVAVLISSSALSGCISIQDDMCSAGEQPVYAVDNRDGKTCIDDGAAVPEGFATYPEKRVPQKVGDKYDRWPLAEDYPWADEVDNI